MKKVLVSACLIGEKVRYDGCGFEVNQSILASWVADHRVVAFCPEMAGGLGVPREPAEIQQGTGGDVLSGQARVLSVTGRDVTAAFLSGARQALELARVQGIRVAVLKARSPSCGNEKVYDGSFQRHQIDGAGVTAALLQENGIRVFNEDQLDAANRFLQALEV